MSAREAIFGRLRGAPVANPKPLPDVTAWYTSRRRQEDVVQRSARLRAALVAAHAEVCMVTAENWAATLLRVCQTKGIRQLLIGNHGALDDALQAEPAQGLEIVRYSQPIAAWQDRLFDGIDASLTLARSAIAETGSLVLWPSASEPRLMSLVPSVHFVLLNEASVHADFHQAMTQEGWTDGMPTNALLISGPSKTADIQQTLAYGAHGPKELVVLLVQSPGAAA